MFAWCLAVVYVRPWLNIGLGLGLGSIIIFATHNIFYRAFGVGGWAVFGTGVRALYIYKESEAIAGRWERLWEGLGLGVSVLGVGLGRDVGAVCGARRAYAAARLARNSSGSMACLRTLQDGQDMTMLSGQLLPPLDRGI